MKKIIYSIATFFCLFAMSGCNDWMEIDPTSNVTDVQAYKSESSIILLVNTFYAYIDRYGQFGAAPGQFNGNMTEGLTETLKYGSVAPGSRAGDANNYVYYPERMSPDGNLLDTWTDTYERIRKVNEFMINLERFSTLSEEKNEYYLAQARFFRAYLYFQLAKRHGGVILYTDLNFQKSKNRSSAEETWDLIEEDLDYAASLLPEDAGSGYLTKGAAFAFKSRAMLYAERWESARNAADSVIALGKYSLMPNYADSWKGNNGESILQFSYSTTQPYHSFDEDYVPSPWNNNFGGKGTPTQEMVEQYEDADGNVVDWTPWHGTTSVRPPWDQLEPRFHATVLYEGSEFKGEIMQNSVGGSYGSFVEYGTVPYAQGNTTTGYYLRKLIDENHDDWSVRSSQTWVEIRYAEVLLNRAEACYRLGETGNAQASINEIRSRVGLPARTSSGTALFDDIRHERKIELAYEGHLYWDMRRWKLAYEEYNNYRVHGIMITGAAGAYTYEYVVADSDDRKFLARAYVFPIPTAEIQNNTGIDQYDEWK